MSSLKTRSTGAGLWMRNAPDRSIAVLGHEERTILRNRNTNRPAPNLFVRYHEACHEVFTLAGRVPLLIKPQAHNLIPGSALSIPRTMHRYEGVSLVLAGEGVAIVECNLER